MYYWILILNILLYGVLTLASHGTPSAGSSFNIVTPKHRSAHSGHSRRRDGNKRRRVSRYPESVLNAGRVTPATRKWVATTLAAPYVSNNHLSMEIFGNKQRQSPRSQSRQRSDSQRWRSNIGRQANTQNPSMLKEEMMLLNDVTERPVGVTRPYNPIYVPRQPEARQVLYETNSQPSINTTPKRKQQSRYRVLPNGSIVNYGTQPTRRRKKNKTAPVLTTAPIPTDIRETSAIAKSILKVFQEAQSTLPQRRQSTLPQRRQSTNLQNAQSTNLQGQQPDVSTAQMSVSKAAQAPRRVPTTTIGQRRFPARQRMQLRHNTDDRRRDDLTRGIVDDPRNNQRVVWSVNLDPINTPYASGRARVTTTTSKPTTTTKKPTTPKPTTTTKKPVQWGYNGGDPVEIRYVNDTHVCPTSRARWQDYTVYLETKPRRCMIQIQWNARYKEEPIYHRSWWGVDVEWVYKTVYDPYIRFVDLHGWK